jgi:hypothetical protein
VPEAAISAAVTAASAYDTDTATVTYPSSSISNVPGNYNIGYSVLVNAPAGVAEDCNTFLAGYAYSEFSLQFSDNINGSDYHDSGGIYTCSSASLLLSGSSSGFDQTQLDNFVTQVLQQIGTSDYSITDLASGVLQGEVLGACNSVTLSLCGDYFNDKAEIYTYAGTWSVLGSASAPLSVSVGLHESVYADVLAFALQLGILTPQVAISGVATPPTGQYTTSPTSTRISCPFSQIDVGFTETCNAQVNGDSPTGAMSFSTSGLGQVSFSSSSCYLEGGTCSVSVKGAEGGLLSIIASYGGDSSNQFSSGSSTIQVDISNFSLGLSSSSISIQQGAYSSIHVNVTASVDFQDTVSLSLVGLPQGINYGFTPTSDIPPYASTLGLFATSAALSGSYNVTVMGTAGDGTAFSSRLTINVGQSSGGSGSFTLSVSSNQGAAQRCGTSCQWLSTTVSISSSCSSASVGLVSPPGWLGWYWASSVTLDLAPTQSAPTGTYPIALRATCTSGSASGTSSTATYQLTILKTSSTTYPDCVETAVGDWTTCSASVSGYNGANPIGTITFGSSNTAGVFSPSPTCTLAGGGCTVRYYNNGAGILQITAAYSGDANNTASGSVTSLTIDKAFSLTTVSCSPNPEGVAEPTKCIASVTGYDPTGTVIFSTSSSTGGFSPPTCTLSNGKCSVFYTDTASGTVYINPSYSGDSNNECGSASPACAGSADTLTLQVIVPPTTVTCSPTSFANGTSTSCRVTVTGNSPTGTVTLTTTSSTGVFLPSLDCTLSGGGCNFTYTDSTPGDPTVNATYVGDVNNQPSWGVITLTVVSANLRTTTTVLSASSSSATFGQLLNLTAVVTDTSSGTPSAPTGTIEFGTNMTSGLFRSAGCVLSATSVSTSQCAATYVAPPGEGTDEISTSYSGDIYHASSVGQFSLAVLSPPLPTLPSGIIKYYPLTLINWQSTATPAPFQSMVSVDSAAYSSYEASNLNNIEFFTPNGIVVPSWLESGNSNASTSTIYWLKFPNGIPALSSVIVYIGFASIGTILLNTQSTGEAPRLSPTYAEYDDGANVFNFYSNFAGTSLSSQWTTNYSCVPLPNHSACWSYNNVVATVNDGLTLTGPPTGSGGGIITTSTFSYPQYVDFNLLNYTASGGNPSLEVEQSTGNVLGIEGFDYGYGPSIDGTTRGGITAWYDFNNGGLIEPGVNFNVGSLPSFTLPAVFSFAWNATGSEDGMVNYGPSVKFYDTTNGIGPFYLSIEDVGSSYSATGTFQWIRTRSLSPDGMMPSVLFQLPLSAGAVTPSIPTIDNGQSLTLRANPTGGSGSYDFQWYAGSSSNCSADPPVSGAQQSTYDTSPSSSAYYCYSVMDISNRASTATSGTDYVIVNSALTIGSPSFSSATIDTGQNVSLTTTPSGGTEPYRYTWNLPAGVNVVSGCTTVSSACELTSTVAGSFSVSVTVEDATGARSTSQSVSFTVLGMGLLRVQGIPAVWTTITVDGVPLNDWGVNWLPLPAKNYTVQFTNIPGFQGPDSYNLTFYGLVTGTRMVPIDSPIPIYAGTTTVVTLNFQQEGTLHIVTSPAVSGTIYVNGTAINPWGAWVSPSPGAYVVSFGNVSGLTAPSPQSVTLLAGQTLLVTGTYTTGGGTYTQPPNQGLLRIVSNPAVPTTISVNGLHMDDWGVDWLPLSAGNYIVGFTDVPMFSDPAFYNITFFGQVAGSKLVPTNSPIPVYANTTTVVSIPFVEEGTLKIDTSPATNALIYVNGTAMDPWGDWVSLVPAEYTVSFQAISGLTTPQTVTVAVKPGAQTTVTGDYNNGTTGTSSIAVPMVPAVAGTMQPSFFASPGYQTAGLLMVALVGLAVRDKRRGPFRE